MNDPGCNCPMGLACVAVWGAPALAGLAVWSEWAEPTVAGHLGVIAALVLGALAVGDMWEPPPGAPS